MFLPLSHHLPDDYTGNKIIISCTIASDFWKFDIDIERSLFRPEAMAYMTSQDNRHSGAVHVPLDPFTVQNVTVNLLRIIARTMHLNGVVKSIII